LLIKSIAPSTVNLAGKGPADGGRMENSALIEDLVAANRILSQQGVVDGFGHVSARSEADPARFLLARSMAPALVAADDIMELDLDGNALDQRSRTLYVERFIHSEIYKAHPAVKAIVHSHSPSIIPFGATAVPLRPIYHMSSFLGAGVPIFEIREAGGPATDMLIRSPELGAALARRLGHSAVVLMRGFPKYGGGGQRHRNQQQGSRPPLGAVEAADVETGLRSDADFGHPEPVRSLYPGNPRRRSGVPRAFRSGIQMDDLQRALLDIGYRIRREPECWRVSPACETAPLPRIRRASRKPDPRRSRDLRRWINRLGTSGAASPYRVRRARRG
jgi:ribulose-5-phosphate 4-epimerase/fuculose-1-phosphate aldolase